MSIPAHRITIWENAQRRALLLDFRNDVIRYYNAMVPAGYRDERTETETSQQIKIKLNLTMSRAIEYVEDAEVAYLINWRAAPMVGGFSRQIHILHNLFNLRAFEIEPTMATDVVEQAIGVYEADQHAAQLRIFNPLYWIGRALRAFSGAPFRILEHAGLGGRKLETTFIGRLIKLVTELAAAGTAVYGFAKLAGWIK